MELKTLSWSQIQSHIHKLSSQFILNEISVNYVGARPNGGQSPSRYCTNWVVALVTADAVNGEILDSEMAQDRTRILEHTPLEGGPRDIQTILLFEVPKVKSPSPILTQNTHNTEDTRHNTHTTPTHHTTPDHTTHSMQHTTHSALRREVKNKRVVHVNREPDEKRERKERETELWRERERESKKERQREM